MSVKLLRAEANERVDLADFQQLANNTFQDLLCVQGNNFLTNPKYPSATLRSWIIDGFGLSNPAGKQLQVDKGRAILAWRTGGTVRHGVITSEGDANKIIDMTAMGAATYNVYIRFEYVDGDNSSRIFWDPAGTGSEITQTVPTRLLANWSLRVETTSPGAEWLQIGTANNAGGSLVIVDQRPMYFEGTPNSTYASGWSAEGGGVANDRNANRATYGVKDLQAFTAAMRQCVEDIKGRGLRRWWAKDIGGMNIGFDAAPVEDKLAVGDANFGLQGNTTEPYFLGDANASIKFDRTNQWWRVFIGGTEKLKLAAGGFYGLDAVSGTAIKGTGGLPNGIGLEGVGSGSGVGAYGHSVAGYGVWGTSVGTHGVYGDALTIGGDGVHGVAHDFGHSGVQGVNNINGGYGVSGNSTFGVGVGGGSTTNYGVYGSSFNLAGVKGASNLSYGVEGTSTNSYGVRGISLTTHGILGVATVANVAGVYGEGNTAGYGVAGVSVNNYGVAGTSTNSAGVYGSSGTNWGGSFVGVLGGVFGTTTGGYGVQGASTTSVGVFGGSTSSVGVYGTSTNNVGVYGIGNVAGVHGYSLLGHGVIAEAPTGAGCLSAFRIVPQAAATGPEAIGHGPNQIGDMYVTAPGVLRICTTAGTPGNWVNVGSQ